MIDTKVLVFVGMPGSGKSTCVEYVEKKNVPSVYFGGITIEEVKARGMEVSEKNEKFVREDIRTKEGADAYAKRVVDKIDALQKQGHNKVIADGLYSWTEYKAFKQKYGDGAIIVAIAAPRIMRHARLAHRPVRPLSDDEVTSREYAEIENIEKGGPIANADYTIVNDGTTQQMLQKVDKILEKENFTE